MLLNMLFIIYCFNSFRIQSFADILFHIYFGWRGGIVVKQKQTKLIIQFVIYSNFFLWARYFISLYFYTQRVKFIILLQWYILVLNFILISLMYISVLNMFGVKLKRYFNLLSCMTIRVLTRLLAITLHSSLI